MNIGEYSFTASGSVLSSKLMNGMSSFRPWKEKSLAAYIQSFTSNHSLHQRPTGSTISSAASRRSFRTFSGLWVLKVRFRYNLPNC
jgi:hypothetical protein